MIVKVSEKINPFHQASLTKLLERVLSEGGMIRYCDSSHQSASLDQEGSVFSSSYAGLRDL